MRIKRLLCSKWTSFACVVCGAPLCTGTKKTCFADFHAKAAAELGATVQHAESGDGHAAQASSSGAALHFGDEDGP